MEDSTAISKEDLVVFVVFTFFGKRRVFDILRRENSLMEGKHMGRWICKCPNASHCCSRRISASIIFWRKVNLKGWLYIHCEKRNFRRVYPLKKPTLIRLDMKYVLIEVTEPEFSLCQKIVAINNTTDIIIIIVIWSSTKYGSKECPMGISDASILCSGKY